MAHALYTNNAVATLASGISAGDTSATLTAGQGALFPNPLTGNYFWGTLNDAATGLVIEIVQVTARSTDTLTIVRAQQGTTANAYLAGDKFELRVTAQGLQDLQPISELGAAAYDNIVTIANGGTNSSSYTAPAGGISPLVYYDGTKFSTDAIVADAGYNTSTNTINSTNFVASANLSGTSLKLGFQSIATNGGTTTFTVTSPYYTIFTGTQSQTVVLPDATTLSVGWKYGVDNDSTQSITINANGGGAFWIVAPGCDLYITLSSNASAAGTWEKDYNAAKVANGKGVTINNSLTLSGTDGTTMTFPSTSSTVVTTSTLNGGTLAASTTSLTDSGNLTFTGTGNRITGDFSNGTIANRVMFQSSTVNGSSNPGVIPNGSGTGANWNIFNSSDPNNASLVSIGIPGATSEVRINSSQTGTGTYLPMTFYTSGSERVRIDTSGNVSMAGVMYIGYTGGDTPDSYGTSPALQVHTSGADGISNIRWGNDANGASFFFQKSRGAVGTNTLVQSGDSLGTILFAGATGTGFNNAAYIGAYVDATPGASTDMPGRLVFATTADGSATPINRLKIDNAGNILNISTGGLGYGTGSGGSVTQLTSKSTPVTLDKTNGQITMSGAALAGNTRVVFNFSNSKIAISDTVIINTQQFGLNYTAIAHGVGTGGCYISVTNVSGGSLSEAVVLNFAVIKAAIT